VMVTGDPTSGVRAPDKLGVMIDNEDYEEADAEGDVEREALAAYRGTMKAELVRAEAKDGDDGVGRAIGCRVDPQELLRRLFGECSVAVSYGSERCTLIKVLPTDDDCDRKIDAFNCEENFEGALDSVLEKRPGTSSWKERNVPGTGPSSNFDDILDAGDVAGLRIDRFLTWTTEPRSREYLNARDEDQASDYYASAYVKPEVGHPPHAAGGSGGEGA